MVWAFSSFSFISPNSVCPLPSILHNTDCFKWLAGVVIQEQTENEIDKLGRRTNNHTFTGLSQHSMYMMGVYLYVLKYIYRYLL